jgi:hypothetical protein
MNKLKATLLLSILCGSNAFAGEQLLNQAKSAEIKSCLSTITDLENFFTKDSNYGSWSSWAENNADDQVFNASLEITFSDGQHLIDLTVAPTKDGQCSYTYSRTFYSEKSCMAFSKSDMKTAEYKTELNKNITMFEDTSAKWFLSSAGSGCLVQKKEW